jgi:NAD(P)-dependent dehydrogenase (short-subunit alcohol dehydrogenase family)
MNRVDGKVALVSGSAQGIGAATAKLLAQAGAKVVVSDLQVEQGEQTAKEIRESGGEARFERLDVTSEADWKAVLGRTEADLGGLDVLVNNAGVELIKPIAELTLEDWRFISSINLDGVFLGTKYGIDLMKRTAARNAGGASIVNLSSVAGIVGTAFQSAYNMSKGGVRLFTKSTALECASLGLAIRVNSVHPGLIHTPMGEQWVDEFTKVGWGETREATLEAATNLHPIGRLGEPEDVAKAILFLASDDAAFITGSELVVDGGLTAQ